ncbi:MAG: polysaccharide biosynthesis tyrosine autokinase [bacterium]|nr:polysaccharide biosynthesis tyrosine autokinase [bacterium]
MKRNPVEGSYEQMPQMEAAVEPYAYERRRTIRDLFHILLRRKWIPVGCVVMFVAFAAISSMRAIPQYMTTSQIEIGTGNLNVLPFREVVESQRGWYIDQHLNTQYKILKSRSLAEKVAAKVKKAGHPQDRDLTAGSILGMTKVEPVRDSRIASIVAQSPLPGQTARVANALAECYIEQDLSKKTDAIRMVTEELRGELEKAKKEVDAAEEKFTLYKERNNIVSLNEKQNLVLEELSKLNEAAAGARTERLRKEVVYNQFKALSPEQLKDQAEVINNPLVQHLKQKELEAVRSVEALERRYGYKHPTLVSGKSELVKIREAVEAQMIRTAQELANAHENAYQKAKTEEESLVEAVGKKKQEVLEFTRRVNQYEGLLREVDTTKKLYDEILNRSRETDISERTEKSDVRIVDRAEVPGAPFKPRTERNIMLALIAGLIIGCGGAFFVEHLNDKVESPDDIEGYIGKPFLGAVPIITDNSLDGIDEKARFVHLSPESTVSEAYRTLLAGIHYSPAVNGMKTILVTSAGPSEGKTTTLTNMGIAAAQNGKRVLLVDSDLRRPTLHKIFGLRKEIGLTDYLVGEAGLEHIIQETDIPNLSVIARGASSPNPSGLISSERMKEFAKRIRDSYDLVLFDSPPCTVVSDPLILGNAMDAVINVAQCGRYSRKMIGRGIELLEGVNANVIGVVLNEVKERDHRYYYYYGYRYYYADDGEKKHHSRKRNKKRASKT